jgi:hypothetical protein
MTQKVEFAGPEWMAAIEAKFRRFAEGPGRDIKLSICEVFTDVPSHLDRDGNGRIAWHCHIGDGKLAFAYGEIDQADIKNIADYQTILPFARLMLTPETQEAYQRMAAEAMAAGKLKRLGDPAKIPASLHGLHNEMAEITA